jgi:hypothetical protein
VQLGDSIIVPVTNGTTAAATVTVTITVTVTTTVTATGTCREVLCTAMLHGRINPGGMTA